MTQVEHLQKEIDRLSDEEFKELRRWFAEKDWERWDREIEVDVESGKLDFLLKEAEAAKEQETIQEL
jgi:hypothetical protein